MTAQFYDKLRPGKGETSEAAGGDATDIAAAIADEVAQLKDQGNRLFVYHKTNVNGLAYLSMKADAGNAREVLVSKANKHAVVRDIAVIVNKCCRHLRHGTLIRCRCLCLAEGPGPVELASALAQEVKQTRQCRTRYCCHTIPAIHLQVSMARYQTTASLCRL